MSVTIFRPGTHLYTYGDLGTIDIRQRRSAGGAVQQSYLLDFDSYGTTYDSNRSSGREFSVSATAQCYGARMKAAKIATVTMRLWRVSDEANIASLVSTAVVAGENELLFAAPVDLSIGALYRIVTAPLDDANRTAKIWVGVVDHPDGPIVTLTSNSFVYSDVETNYPAGLVAWSSAIEPIIYT